MKTTITFIFFFLSCFGYSQVSSDYLFKSFKQGDRGNCAAIALIKAALNIYGVEGLFNRAKLENGSFRVFLKNGDSLLIDQKQLDEATQSAGFVILDSSNQEFKLITEYAIFAYCVMARYKQITEKIKTYETSLEDLEYGEGENAYGNYKYLGFKKGEHIIHLRRLTGNNLCGLMAFNLYHAVYACDGYMDYHGIKRPLWVKYSARMQVIRKH